MTTNQVRLCARPTRRGGTCRTVLQWYEVACTFHATPAELDAAALKLRLARYDASEHRRP